MGILSFRGSLTGSSGTPRRSTHHVLAAPRLALRRRARQADPAGAAGLLDPVRPDELLEGVDVLGRSDDLEDERLGPEVGDARVEDVGEREQLAALVGRRVDLDQRELPLDRFARLELLDA